MAAGDFITYDDWHKNQWTDGIALSTAGGEFGCWILTTTDFTPAQATHDTFSDVTNELSTATDYDRVLINTMTISTAITANRVTLDCADVDFGASVTLSAKYMILVNSGANGVNPAAGDYLVGYVDLNSGGDALSSVSGPFQVTINASGLFDVRQST